MPTVIKQTPDARVLIWPTSAIPQLSAQGFVVADRMGCLVFPGSGGYSYGFEADLNPSATAGWTAEQFYFTSLSPTIGFVRFNADGTCTFGPSAQGGSIFDGGNEIAGFFITPRLAYLDTKLTGATLDTDFTDIHFDPVLGSWQTTLAPADVPRTEILNSALATTTVPTAIVRSAGTVPANRSLVFDWFLQTGASGGGRAAARAIVGDRWSVHAINGQPFTIEKRNPAWPGAGDEWQIIKTLEGSAANFSGGQYAIWFMRLGGRGVCIINSAGGGSRAWWWWDRRGPLVPGAPAEDQPPPKDVTWPEARLQFNVANAHVRFGVRVVKWCEADGTALVASGARSIIRTHTITGTPTIATHHGSWNGEGTGLALAAELVPNRLNYTFILTGSADGIDTPLLHQVVIRVTPLPTAPAPPSLDLRAATLSIDVTLALPPAANGATAKVDLNRVQLDEKYPTHSDVLKDDSPIEIQVHWRNSDGSYGDWVTLFKGYCYESDDTTAGYNKKTRTLTCLDDVCRLIKPAAFIDQRHPPLAAKAMELAAGAVPTPGGTALTAAFYGYHAIEFIAAMFLGDAVAAGINGNGDGLRYFPPDHPPLWSQDADHAGYLHVATALGDSTALPVVSQGAFLFPPPYGSDAYSWMQSFRRDDKAVVFFERGVLMYGRLTQILATRTVRRIADADYIAGDVSRLIESMSTHRPAAKAINRVVAWSQLDTGVEGVTPALRIGEDRVPDTDPASAVHSWEKTHLVTTNFNLISPEAIAHGIVQQLTGLAERWPDNATVRGEENAVAGDVVFFAVTSLPELDGQYARVETCRHRLSFDGELSYTTTYGLRPTTAEERAAMGI